MKKFTIFFLIFCVISAFSFANAVNKDGFYVGVDPEKTNNKIGNINNAVSLESKIAEDHYYGYKFIGGGFFVSPELFMQNGNKLVSNNISSPNSTGQNSPQIGGALGATYDVKANVGYEFNKYFSGFLTYNVGSFAYNPQQRNIAIGSGTATNSAIGIGSQINLSNSFGIKFMYTQQQFENSATGNGQIRSDVVKFGTVYSF